MLCLEKGKSILCEKALALNYNHVGDMVETAGRKGLFFMEALWPPFQPSYQKAHEIINSGRLGKIKFIRSEFAFMPEYNPNDRLFKLELGGGALLDIGIYPVIDALTFLGVPSEIKAITHFADSGADETINILFGYKEGISASLYASFRTNAGISTNIVCEKGNLILRRGKDPFQTLQIEEEEKKHEVFTFSPKARGYQFEAIEVMKCLDRREIESSIVPTSFSLDLMKILDRIMKITGISYEELGQ
jgi:predicted dehydrogenase